MSADINEMQKVWDNNRANRFKSIKAFFKEGNEDFDSCDIDCDVIVTCVEPYSDTVNDDDEYYDKFTDYVYENVNVVGDGGDGYNVICDWSAFFYRHYDTFKEFALNRWGWKSELADYKGYDDTKDGELCYEWIKELRAFLAGYTSESVYKEIYEKLKADDQNPVCERYKIFYDKEIAPHKAEPDGEKVIYSSKIKGLTITMYDDGSGHADYNGQKIGSVDPISNGLDIKFANNDTWETYPVDSTLSVSKNFMKYCEDYVLNNYNKNLESIVKSFFNGENKVIETSDGQWKIANGGYDLVAEIYKDNIPVLQVIDDKQGGYDLKRANDSKDAKYAEKIVAAEIGIDLRERDFSKLTYDYSSPDFQSGIVGCGFPIMVCVNTEECYAFLLPNSFMSDGFESAYEAAYKECVEYGKRDCWSVEDFNKIASSLADSSDYYMRLQLSEDDLDFGPYSLPDNGRK